MTSTLIADVLIVDGAIEAVETPGQLGAPEGVPYRSMRMAGG